MADIVRAAIHPGIGIARVGNSREEFFIGPELPYPVAAPKGGYKDKLGALKRQAARFRVYGYDATGKIVAELTSANADVAWTVHTANKKAAWYNFDSALDIPEAVPAARRNAAIAGADRDRLVIDPGPRRIAGANKKGKEFELTGGTFLEISVALGELRTDDAGRLVVLGGHGVSGSAAPNNTIYSCTNNDGWYDDTSDGPVTAEVRIGGRSIPVEPAWVVVAPPNYAPDIISVPTMHDVISDACRAVWFAPVTKPSFTKHILPILEAFVNLQWVSFGFHVQFGWKGPNNFTRPDFLAKLADPSPAFSEHRRQVFNMFRKPTYTSLGVDAWPQLYGDGTVISGEIGTDTDLRQYLALTSTQSAYLQAWSNGVFHADWNPAALPPAQQIEDVPLQQQPHTLDEASLKFCLGGAFHPGCEMTWPMRHYTMYSAPFRVRPRAAGMPEPDYGDELTPAFVASETGPLFAQGPGGLTRWMAVPWQADTGSCRAGYEGAYDPYLPTFWPARVPNHVLSQADYEKVMNRKLPLAERQAAFERRSTWYRILTGPAPFPQLMQLLGDFGELGVLERKAGPKGDADFPDVMYVESTPGIETDAPFDRNLRTEPAFRRLRSARRPREGD